MRIFRSFAMRLIMTTMLFIVLISVVITLVMTQQYSQTLMRQTESTTLSAFRVAAQQIDQLLSDARMVSVHATQNEEILRFLRGDFTSNAAYIEARRDMIGAMRDYFVRYDYMNGLMVISKEGVVLGATPSWTFTWTEPTPVAKTLVDQVAEQSVQHIVWLGTYRTRAFYSSIDSQVSVSLLEVPMICAIEPRTFTYSNKAETMYVLLSITKESVDRALTHLDDAEGVVSLLNQEGRLITGGDEAELGDLQPYASAFPEGSASGSMEIELDGERVQMIYQQMPSTGWMLTKRIPLAVYNSLTDSLRRVSLVTCLLALVAISALYSVWATRFMRPLKRITQVLRAIEDGRDDRMNSHSGVLEFDLIGRRFNAMMDSMAEMHRREIQAQQELLVLEIRNLQSQINPHFLYNSITSIRWLATIMGAEKVSDMLVELAEILKPIFSQWRLEWQLKDELAFIQHYMQLMQLRYGAGFVVSGQLPDELLDAYIPRFILQPLLENACEHGKDENGRIEVVLDAFLDGEDAVLRVQDNGLGMDAETLRRVQEALLEGRQSSGNGSIGLCNVHQRIQLYFGPGYGLTIHSEPGSGVRIDMRIRVRHERSELLAAVEKAD